MSQSLYLARIVDASVPALLAVDMRHSSDAIIYRSALFLPSTPPVLREVIRSSPLATDHDLALQQAEADAKRASFSVTEDDFKPTEWSTLQWWAIASQITREELTAAASHMCSMDESELAHWVAAISRIKS